MGAEQSGDAEHKHSDYSSSGECLPTMMDLWFFCVFFIFIKSTLIEENQGNISIYATVVMYMKSSIHFPNAVMK